MFKRIMPFIIVFGCFALAHTQGECHYTLRGRVCDEITKQPVPFAAVLVKEIAVSSVTDENGFFEIKNLCRQNYTLEFSHVECQKHVEKVNIEGNTEGVFSLQHDDKLLEKVVVTEKRIALEATQTQSSVKNEDLERTKGQVLGDVLKSIAGVTTLNTGSTISKPVVQGLHSDRVLLFNNGVRQEGQQWGLDHAPEIDPFIADQISVVKGAASVKYGVGAIGGVILVEPRALRDTVGVGGEVNLVGFSNGRMGVFSTMIEGKNPLFSWRLQGTAKKGGNLTTPQYLLANTGVEELNGSASLGFKVKNVRFEVFYSHFYSKIGIFKESHIGNLTDLKTAIERGRPYNEAAFSYDIGRPAQMVNHDILKLKTTMPTGDAGRLSLTAFYQYDLREEFDAHRPGGKIPVGFDRAEIAFQMPSLGARADWEHRPLSNWHGGGGFEGLFQDNNTFAGGLIPSYRQKTAGGYWTERWRKFPNPLEFEAGVRYDVRQLDVDSNRFGNQNRSYNFANVSGSVGAIYHLGAKGKLTFNLGTAWRSPNVNELFSNGVHHGTASFELGDPNLVPERAVNTSLSFHFDTPILEIEASVFQNSIANFIYLKPDSVAVLTIRGAFPAFSYRQTDAILRGGDVTTRIKLSKKMSWQIKGSMLFAENTRTSEWLPLMPQDQLENQLRIDLQDFMNFKKSYFSVSLISVRKQTRVSLVQKSDGSKGIDDFAPAPEGYHRLDLSAGTTWKIGRQPFDIHLTVQNAMNTNYRDYLDRFRYFTDATGINVSLKLKTVF